MQLLKRFFKEEDGITIIEVVLILAVVIGLIVIFRNALGQLMTKIWNKINGNTNSIIDDQTKLTTD